MRDVSVIGAGAMGSASVHEIACTAVEEAAQDLDGKVVAATFFVTPA